MKTKILLPLAVMLLTAGSCKKLEVAPSDAITTETLINTPEGLANALNGAYALFKDHIEFNGTVDMNNMYLRQFYHLSDFASDDIVCGQVTTDPLYYSFSLDHSPSQGNTRYFWYVSYKIINGVNTIIDAVEKQGSEDATKKQLLGECYFLRAFCHFNLVRLFAKPYSVDPNSPGIILRTSLTDPAQKGRSTVAEVYGQVIADAEKAAGLMTQVRGVQYASKEAAWALLSRVNLYKEDNAKAIEYADDVINSGRFTLTNATSFKTMFANATNSTETIFCIAFTDLDDYGKFGSIASMIYSDGNSGWGEEFASSSIRSLLNQHPEDARNSYIVPSEVEGVVQKKNGIEMYYITKFSFQGGSPNLSSPIMFRLAEMYLIKAEALAKQNNTAAALENVDKIRENRGLENMLYNGTLPAGKSALDVVLEEKRMEFAFEGHRTYDVFRNKRTLDKTYWGYHLRGLKETDVNLATKPSGYPNMTVPYTSPRTIYFIPVDEVLSNPEVTQNP
ncbi:RagB/SusD family nutrient uptake outer membrane protein [Mucilaginibacter limnophilus]|uniref:RagB/SusD family nutrient uptake outer membrane protein n=1 Tax=Mucilaginibacter limnophilus TaxID=1932778 RepID=A0A437MFS4_9SPHI|nr:RagB/SusD family nutrient uptake outer membrane protein [Mucilaginibacter limnophilus]RVT96465.1 RagB/SusD family nutrient uptake outer membrane protein [Mucilaginibacter limnophilus]